LSANGLEPPDADAHYSERLVRLPHLGTFLVEPQRPPSDPVTNSLESRRSPVFIGPGTPFKHAP
jgi:hypothetical protein